MGNVNIGGQKPNISPVKPPSNTTKPETKPVEPELELTPILCDQSHTQDPFKDKLGKMPNLGGPGIKPAPMFNDYGKDVDRVLSIGVAHVQARENGTQIKTPDVEFHLDQVMDDMTPGEKDELRDAIVDRMSSKDTSQRERDVLQRMYNHVDQAAGHAGGKPNKIIFKELEKELQKLPHFIGGDNEHLLKELKPTQGGGSIQQTMDSISQGIKQAEGHGQAQGQINKK